MKDGALRVATHRLRHRFRIIVFSIIAETLDDPTEANVRAKIGVLMESLARHYTGRSTLFTTSPLCIFSKASCHSVTGQTPPMMGFTSN
jgi:hypothetical protein